MNYYIQDFCCICLKISNEKCSNESSKYPDNLTPFDKIKTVFLELSAVMDSEDRICKKCSGIVDLIYEFHKTALKNSRILLSYKNVLRGNKLKKQCHLFVNLDESKQFKENELNYYIQDFCCICLNIPNEKCSNKSLKFPNNLTTFDKIKTAFLELSAVMESENRTCKKCSGTVDLIYEFHKTCLRNNHILSSYKNVLRENKLKNQCHLFVNLNESKQFRRNTLISKEANIQRPELLLKNDDSLCDTDFVSKSYSNDSAEIKKIVGMNYEAFDEESRNTIEETSEDESYKPNVEDFENSSDQSSEEVANEEEDNRKSHKDVLLEVVEGKSHERQVHFESSGENPSKSPREKPIHNETEQFDCTECSETFSCKLDFDSHMQSHAKRQTHKCNVCGKLFTRMGALRHHTVKHTGEKLYQCETCGRLFTWLHNLISHQIMHSDKKSEKCDVCGKLFARKESLKKHTKIHTGEKRHKCDICGKSFTQKVGLKDHILIHTDKKSYECDICQKSFRFKQNLKRHILEHSGEKRHKCDICGKSFTRNGGLKSHMTTHTGEKPYKCDICKKSFREKRTLRKHMIKHTDLKPHKCNICQKSFKFKRTIVTHMIVHTDEKPFKCDICKKSFKRKHNLEVHNLTHSSERPYKCDICKNSFKSKIYLHIHMSVHTGEKPHKCDSCGNSFKRKEALKLHMLTHTGEKPHKCESCGRLFNRMNTLKRHMLTHTGGKTYKCDICGKSLTRKEALKLHMLTHKKKILTTAKKTKTISAKKC